VLSRIFGSVNLSDNNVGSGPESGLHDVRLNITNNQNDQPSVCHDSTRPSLLEPSQARCAACVCGKD